MKLYADHLRDEIADMLEGIATPLPLCDVVDYIRTWPNARGLGRASAASVRTALYELVRRGELFAVYRYGYLTMFVSRPAVEWSRSARQANRGAR